MAPGRLPNRGDGSVSPSSGVTAAMSRIRCPPKNHPNESGSSGRGSCRESRESPRRSPADDTAAPPTNHPVGWGTFAGNSPYQFMEVSMGSVVKYDRTLFEPEHDSVPRVLRAFLDRHVAPYNEQWGEGQIVDRGVWLEAGKQGFLGMAVPEEYGRRGLSRLPLQRDRHRGETTAGRYSGIGFGLHNDVVAPYLLRLANDEQKARWLPKFCTGEIITAIAMTEPGTGSDLQGIKTRAAKEGDHYILNGAKTFITNGI